MRTLLRTGVGVAAHAAAAAWRSAEQWLSTSSATSNLLDAADAVARAARRTADIVTDAVLTAMRASRRRPATTSVAANVALAVTIAALTVMVVSEDSTTTAAVDKTLTQGAAALGSNPALYEAPEQAGGVVPDPLAAPSDSPAAYADGCQVQRPDSKPVICEFGDPDGDVDVVLVGDSKALQWVSAIDQLGQRHGWHVQSITKSACSFSATPRIVEGEPYASCAEWNETVRDRLVDDPPDLVITSQRAQEGMNDPDDPDAGESPEAMADGLHDRWEELIDAGSNVAVLRDNPSPSGGAVANVYECVAENPDDLASCSFSRSDGEEASAGDTQLLAADNTPDAHVVDLNDYICPTDTCPPVIGGVLIYRQGSHITQTYVDSLIDQLESQLTPLVNGSDKN